ncbi:MULTISPECIES: MFS transporter [Pseudonocardia]|uniref:Proline/betaine transporter n=2 Tax=Pseudonocardia TaxID=1847 RepID=A0A1Y2N8W4_PSEAH|nr:MULTISPECIES: MFS transporter [Pseudonocardia]OSY43925.1 Proline/betaine transporter [Pseudonocardia autotrophica]TDN74342.1 putative MFS family arabinose efflux permease [Pseudonocardia autotrophica]BBG05106.1 MFS transporter [Pseudonocardia autotrophica]GEC27901.1 MFS transporter [Pseudonocardia saturnea]
MAGETAGGQTSGHAGGRVTVTDAEARKVAFGAFVGTALEWYDFFLYGTAAALVFNRLYFATDDVLVSTLAAFASFAVGFAARPLGAVIFGHLGDRIGRKRCLIITVTMIGIVTGLIGLLPDFAAIGIAAPLLLTLLRLLQGVAVGGEWGGAVTLAVEHAPPERRGRYAAMPQIGSPVGTLLSSGAFLAVAQLPPESFDAWGWRIPFLAAFPLLGIAVWLRRRVEESPLFERMLAQDERSSSPVREVLRRAWPQLLVGAGTTLLGVGGFYLITTFVISYGTSQLGLPRSLMLGATLVAAAIEIGVLILGGRLAERYGAWRVTVAGGIASALMAFPAFWLIDTGAAAAVIIGVTVATALLSIPYAVSGALLTELFPPHLRYSGVALSANLAGVVSGFVPLVATALLAVGAGTSTLPALLLVGIALVTTASGAVAPRFFAERDRVATGD